MPRYIDADALIDRSISVLCGGGNEEMAVLVEDIDSAPTIDAVEVVRGEWIDKPTKGVRYICSRCRGRFDYQWKYCPNCGARMKGADDDNND